MANNAELQHKVKELESANEALKNQVQTLESQVKADVVSKDDYDKVNSELEALKQQVAANGFPTLKADLEAVQKRLATANEERDQARKAIVEAGNKIRALERNQRVERPTTDADGESFDPRELRPLAALCLSVATDEAGRPLNAPTLKHNGPNWVAAALELGKEIIRQTS